MRVALVSANFRPHVGGIERFTEILAAGLAGRGHQVTVLCCRFGAAPKRERDGFDVVRIPCSYATDRLLGVPYPLPSPVRLIRTVNELLETADVVHAQDALYATSVAALARARRRGVPGVLTQHVAFVPQHSRALDGLQHAAIATVGRSARLATVVATLNPAVATWARERWGLRDVRVLPVGVPPRSAAAADRVELRRSFGLPPDRFLALFVGRDVPKKGLDVFLGARDAAYDLVAVTDRPAVGNGAVVLPFMSPERLEELRACVDAFVLPSEGEGFPVSLQEAFACGLPVVTTFQPGYDRYLDSGDALFVERDRDAVRTAVRSLVDDVELRRRLGGRSRAVAERHFGVDRFVSGYEALYAEAISIQSSRRPQSDRASAGRT
jgi:glycosyltransferase involved in cell wall biosynthesis